MKNSTFPHAIHILTVITALLCFHSHAQDSAAIPPFDSFPEGSAKLFGFNPIRYQNGVVGVWDRDYSLAANGIISGIRGAGRELTRGAIRLEGECEGAAFAWKGYESKLEEKNDDRITLQIKGREGKVDVAVKALFEYDGMARFQVRFSSAKSFSLKDVTLKIPLPSSQARYLHHIGYNSRAHCATIPLGSSQGLVWESKKSSSYIPFLEQKFVSNFDPASSFMPVLWIGDAAGGIAWFAESDEGWQVDDRISFAEVVRAGEETDLLLHFVMGQMTTNDFRLDFGLQATPVKKMTADFRELKIMETAKPELYPAGFSKAKRFYTFDFDGGSSHTSNRFARSIDDPDRLLKMVEMEKQRGFRYGAYICLDMISPSRRPGGYEAYGGQEKFLSNWVRHPFALSERFPRDRDFHDVFHITGFNVKENLADMLRYAEMMLSRYGLELLYLDDNLFRNNLNLKTGDCYQRPDGKLQPIYRVYQWRSFMKKLAALFIKYRNSIAGIFLHNTNVFFPPIMAFSGFHMPGELLGWHGVADQMDHFAGARGIVELSGTPWGVPSALFHDLKYSVYSNQCLKMGEPLLEQTNYKTKYGKALLAAAFLHDASVYGAVVQEKLTPYENVKYPFVQDEGVTFHPYFGEGAVQSDREGVKVSHYLKPNGVLLVVGNFSKQVETATLALGQDILSIAKGDAVFVDEVKKENIPIESGRVRVSVPPHEIRLLQLKTNP